MIFLIWDITASCAASLAQLQTAASGHEGVSLHIFGDLELSGLLLHFPNRRKCADLSILATLSKPDPELSAAEEMQLVSITSHLLLATFPDQLSHHMNAEVSFNMRSNIIKSSHATLINYISCV